MGFLNNLAKGLGGAFGFGGGDKTSDVLEQQRAISDKQNQLAEQRLGLQKRQGEDQLETDRLRQLREKSLQQNFLNQRFNVSGIRPDDQLSQLQNPGNLASKVV